uniref:BAR domain-containing protein n=1 Tax=Panagrolaimus sp. ES5 TaxID=591445 RepID=A0AC34FXB7_9BILA
EGGNDLKKQLEAAAKLGSIHRDFHRRARRSLRTIRLFLCLEYDELWEARKVLNERRQDMDFAKHELKNAKAPEVVEMKNLVYENAQKHFESQLQKVLQLLDQFPKWKEVHLKDIQQFQTVYKLYHEQMSHVLTSK